MKKEVEVKSTDNTGATPIAKLVQLANSFESSIYLTKDGIKVNAKSIMGMMNMVLSSGTIITMEASGSDEEVAIEQIESFLKNLRDE